MSVNVRQAHPNYWVSVMTFSGIYLALALNFLFLNPSFLIFGAPNQVWGSIFLMLSIGQILLISKGCLRWLRRLMACSVVYLAVLGAGTSQPFLDRTGSLQLPIMYVGLATLLVPLRAEPPSNPLTMKEPTGGD